MFELKGESFEEKVENAMAKAREAMTNPKPNNPYSALSLDEKTDLAIDYFSKMTAEELDVLYEAIVRLFPDATVSTKTGMVTSLGKMADAI